MRAVCAGAVERGVSIGAQVSYADRPNFGRVAVDVAYEILRDRSPTRSACCPRSRGGRGRGALPQAARRALPPGARRRGAGDGGARGLGDAAGARHAGRAARPGVRRRPRVFLEGFPDRGYGDDGRLLPRGRPGPWSRTATRSRLGPSSWPGRCARCACTATRRARWLTRARAGSRWRPPASSSRSLTARSSWSGPLLHTMCRTRWRTCGEVTSVVDDRPDAVEQPVGPEVCEKPAPESLAGVLASRVELSLPTPTRRPGQPGRAEEAVVGQQRSPTPRGNSGRRPGTGSAGSEKLVGRPDVT